MLWDFAVATRLLIPSSVREESGSGDRETEAGTCEQEWDRVGIRSIVRSTLTAASTVARPAMQDGEAMGMGRTPAVHAQERATIALPYAR